MKKYVGGEALDMSARDRTDFGRMDVLETVPLEDVLAAYRVGRMAEIDKRVPNIAVVLVIHRQVKEVKTVAESEAGWEGTERQRTRGATHTVVWRT